MAASAIKKAAARIVARSDKAKRNGPLPLPPGEKRVHCVSVRLNDAELAALDCSRGRLLRGEYLRMAWNEKLPPAPAPELNRQAWAELARAAANLNQIAKHMNQGGELNIETVRAELAAFRLALLTPASFQGVDDETA